MVNLPQSHNNPHSMDPDVSELHALKWSALVTVIPSSFGHVSLVGDKILLPPSALSPLLNAVSPPQPLTFRLVNPINNRIAYAGIREFSAQDGEVVLSESLCYALDITNTIETTMKISVNAVHLPKGQFVKLRPLEAGYDADNWKALLEQHIRNNYTTLTKGDILNLPSPDGGNFKLLVDELKPQSDAVCVVNTDLEVAIEALDEDQARETVKIRAEKAQATTNSNIAQGNAAGGPIGLSENVSGKVVDNTYVDYTLISWHHSHPPIEILLTAMDENDEINLFVSAVGPQQRLKPRSDQYQFTATEGRYPRRLEIDPNHPDLENAESIAIAVHAYSQLDSLSLSSATNTSIKSPRSYNLYIRSIPSSSNSSANSRPSSPSKSDETQCQNCLEFVPQRTLLLHQNFCFRNNIRCPKCSLVFLKASPSWAAHWHCPHDSFFSSTVLSQAKHDAYNHTPSSCPSCPNSSPLPSLAAVARHRTSDCPAKPIICRFCHLQVPQGPPNPQARLRGLTDHELEEGARTTECHICGEITALIKMDAHLALHESENRSRLPPRLCATVLCGRSRDGVDAKGNTRVLKTGYSSVTNEAADLGLCGQCFGPLYVAIHDPDGRLMRSRVERKYLKQFISGCENPQCSNDWCKIGRQNKKLPAKNIKEAMSIIKPTIQALKDRAGKVDTSNPVPMKFCVDIKSQADRHLAGLLAMEGVYALEWCIGAVEIGGRNDGKAREWLAYWAPKISASFKNLL